MFSAIEAGLAAKWDRQAMERNLEELHERLDEYEGELAGYYAGIQCAEARRNQAQSRPAALAFPVG
jgi:hypothetical protein